MPTSQNADNSWNTIKVLFTSIAVFLTICFDYVVDFIFSLWYNTKRQVPPVKNSLLLESATSLAKKIRKQEIKSEDLVKLFIARIEEVNPIINAVVEFRFEEALAEARQVDTDIKNGNTNFENKPFLGVPFTSKSTTLAKGMNCTFGLVCRKGTIVEEDAEVIRLLKEAGGILLGITNVPQLSMWQETSNPIDGTSNNPYNTTRNVGGSSGGEGAIIAASGSPLGIGTDIGGSVRIPSYMCGIFGHKPTNGIISTKGMSFRKCNETDTMATAGPMVKHSEDLLPFFKVLVGNKMDVLKLDVKVNVRDLNIFYVKSLDTSYVSGLRSDVEKVLDRTIKYFEDKSTTPPTELLFPEMTHNFKLWKYWLSQENGYSFSKNITNKTGEVNCVWELIKYLTGTSDLNIYSIIILLNKPFENHNAQWCKDLTATLKAKLLAKLGNNGVLIFPSAPFSARYHFASILQDNIIRYNGIWNVLRMPVTQVPLGLDSEGLPVGLQVVAAPYQDHLCIAVAKELEKAFGGYVPPSTRVL